MIPVGPAANILDSLNIRTRVSGGRISIAETKVVVKAGERVSKLVADALKLLDIKPIEVTLNMQAAIDKSGVIYIGKALSLSDEELQKMVQDAAGNALSLAINLSLLTSETLPYLLSNASLEATSLAFNIKLPVVDVLPLLLKLAAAEAESLRNTAKF